MRQAKNGATLLQQLGSLKNFSSLRQCFKKEDLNNFQFLYYKFANIDLDDYYLYPWVGLVNGFVNKKMYSVYTLYLDLQGLKL